MPEQLQDCSLTWMCLIVSGLGLGLDHVLNQQLSSDLNFQEDTSFTNVKSSEAHPQCQSLIGLCGRMCRHVPLLHFAPGSQ